MATRETLHRLVDELPESAWNEAERYLRGLQTDDPVLRALLTAPQDDEPESEKERALVQEARDEVARGELIDDLDHSSCAPTWPGLPGLSAGGASTPSAAPLMDRAAYFDGQAQPQTCAGDQVGTIGMATLPTANGETPPRAQTAHW